MPKICKIPKNRKKLLSGFRIRFDCPKRPTDGGDTALRRFVDLEEKKKHDLFNGTDSKSTEHAFSIFFRPLEKFSDSKSTEFSAFQTPRKCLSMGPVNGKKLK